MTRLKDATFESASLTGASGASSTSGTVTLDSTSQLKGTYSAAMSASSSFVRFSHTVDTIYVVFYFKYSGTMAQHRLIWMTNVSTGVLRATLQTTGKLRLQTGASGTAIGSDSPVAMVAGNTYRIAVRYTKGTGSDAILQAWFAEGDTPFGAPFAETSVDSATLGVTRVDIGNTAAGTANSVWIDNVRVDDAALPTDDESGATDTPMTVNISSTVVFTKNRSITKTILRTIAASVNIQKNISKGSFTITIPVVLTRRRAISVTKSISSTIVTTVTKLKSLARIVSVSVANQLTVTKAIGKTKTITVPVTITRLRSIGKTIGIVIDNQIIAAKGLAKTIGIAIGNSVTVIRGNGYFITATISSAVNILRQRSIGKTTNIQQPIQITRQRSIEKRIALSITGTITRILDIITGDVDIPIFIKKHSRTLTLQVKNSITRIFGINSRTLVFRGKDDDSI